MYKVNKYIIEAITINTLCQNKQKTIIKIIRGRLAG